MEKILNDQVLNQQLSENGYVTFDCLSDDQVMQLLKLYKQVKPIFWRKPVYCNAFIDQPKKNQQIDDKIISLIETQKIINTAEFDINGGCYIVKKKKKDNEVGLHQDWMITDEKHAQSYVIWIALTDTNIQNGAMVVIPKSNQKFKQTIRSYSFRSLYIPIDKCKEDKMSTLALKAGQAILYSSALFHGSFKNIDSNDRIAVVASIVNKQAEKYYYHFEADENVLYKLKMPEDFYLKYQRKLDKIQIHQELEILETSIGLPKVLTTDEVLN